MDCIWKNFNGYCVIVQNSRDKCNDITCAICVIFVNERALFGDIKYQYIIDSDKNDVICLYTTQRKLMWNLSRLAMNSNRNWYGKNCKVPSTQQTLNRKYNLKLHKYTHSTLSLSVLYLPFVICKLPQSIVYHATDVDYRRDIVDTAPTCTWYKIASAFRWCGPCKRIPGPT